jgi:hypothetical protein
MRWQYPETMSAYEVLISTTCRQRKPRAPTRWVGRVGLDLGGRDYMTPDRRGMAWPSQQSM